MDTMLKLNKPVIEAHRGYRGNFPENTMLAFRKAIAAGAKSIELDIHESADHELIVMHDADVKRTTNGNGPIASLTLPQIKALDAGTWMNPNFAGEKVPTLDAALELTDLTGVRFNVEIKQISREAAVKLAQLLRQHAPMPHANCGPHVVSSFQLDALLNLRNVDDSIPLAILGGDAAQILSVAIDNNLPWMHSEVSTITADIVDRAHAHGIKVMVWTMNDTTKYRHFAEMGVDKITTDWAPEMLATQKVAAME